MAEIIEFPVPSLRSNIEGILSGLADQQLPKDQLDFITHRIGEIAEKLEKYPPLSLTLSFQTPPDQAENLQPELEALQASIKQWVHGYSEMVFLEMAHREIEIMRQSGGPA